MAENRPCPKVTVPIETIYVGTGETVTVFLAGRQVELRVPREGPPEIFVRAEHRGMVRDFAEWEAI